MDRHNWTHISMFEQSIIAKLTVPLNSKAMLLTWYLAREVEDLTCRACLLWDSPTPCQIETCRSPFTGIDVITPPLSYGDNGMISKQPVQSAFSCFRSCKASTVCDQLVFLYNYYLCNSDTLSRFYWQKYCDKLVHLADYSCINWPGLWSLTDHNITDYCLFIYEQIKIVLWHWLVWANYSSDQHALHHTYKAIFRCNVM